MNKAGFIRIFHLLTLVLVLALPALAQGQHALQGRVALPNGAAPSNSVKVTLTFNGMRVYETFTDLSGRFSFSGLRRGTYQLTAEGDGQTFETTRVDADVSAYGSAPQIFTQNIQLRLKAGNSVSTSATAPTETIDANLPARAREEYDKGIKDSGNNKPQNAIKHFEQAIAAHPQFYLAHVALAEQYAKLKRDGEATASYQKAIEMKPDRAPAYVGLGVMLVKQKRYGEAITSLRRSLEIEKASFTPYLFLGLAEMMTGDYQSSEANLLRAYELGKPALARVYLANLYDLKGEPSRAIEQLKAFLKESPNLPEDRQAEIREVIDKLRKQMAAKK
jgi:tetratricopeptide (TPR) repeat protein